jgi:hypothetical protein
MGLMGSVSRVFGVRAKFADSKELGLKTPNFQMGSNIGMLILLSTGKSFACSSSEGASWCNRGEGIHKTAFSHEVSRVIAVRSCEEYPGGRACSYVNAQLMSGLDCARVIPAIAEEASGKPQKGGYYSNIVCQSQLWRWSKVVTPGISGIVHSSEYVVMGRDSLQSRNSTKAGSASRGKDWACGLCPLVGVSPLEP